MSEPLCPRIAEDVAFFQANQKLREAKAGDFEAASRTHTRFYDTICRAYNPDLSLARVIRRLGRDRARAIGVDAHVVERAIRAR